MVQFIEGAFIRRFIITGHVEAKTMMCFFLLTSPYFLSCKCLLFTSAVYMQEHFRLDFIMVAKT